MDNEDQKTNLPDESKKQELDKNVIADSKHGEPAYEQTVKIYYKFVGQISPLEK